MVSISKSESVIKHDKDLAGQIKLGNQIAFAVIYDRYHKQLYALAYRYLKSQEMAEDAVQEVFVNLWTNRIKIDETLNLKGFLFKTGKNYILNTIRNNQRAIEKNYEILMDTVLHDIDQEQLDESVAMTTLIEKAVETLSPQRKLIFFLKTNEELSNKEIGERLNISVNTVKVQYFQILKEIREYVSKNMLSSALLISILFR